MNPPDVTGSVTDLLRRTHGLLGSRLDGRATVDTAVEAALRATVETALYLAELREENFDDPAIRSERMREVYLCTRAAAIATRFAVVDADNQRRVHGRKW